MLQGVVSERRIIVGAYVDGEGGVCPMLAAHRRGGRTNLLAFARSWDRFTRAGRRARGATVRERSILLGQLQASLAGETRVDLAGAISEHRALSARHAPVREADPRGGDLRTQAAASALGASTRARGHARVIGLGLRSEPRVQCAVTVGATAGDR